MERSDVLRVARGHPSVEYTDGDLVIADGEHSTSLVVLAAGELSVRTGSHEVARIIEPGDVVGEIGLLLGTPASADVVAVGSTVVHRIDDAASLFADEPGFGQHLAVVLATRLRRVTTFLGDLDRQFADRRDTLGLVPEVLGALLTGAPEQIDAGSEREPESPY